MQPTEPSPAEPPGGRLAVTLHRPETGAWYESESEIEQDIRALPGVRGAQVHSDRTELTVIFDADADLEQIRRQAEIYGFE